MRQTLVISTIITGLAAASAANGKPAPGGIPPSMQSLVACRALVDPVQRLACFDRTSGAVVQAIDTKQLVMIDKERANAAKRSLFGFSMPNFGGLFGGGGDDEINQIDGTVAAVTQNRDGGWTVKLADGSVWTQNDDTPIAIPPQRGDKVLVKRGTLGSYFLRLNGQPGVKAHRIG